MGESPVEPKDSTGTYGAWIGGVTAWNWCLQSKPMSGISCDPWLTDLQEAIRAVQSGDAEVGVHQLRVCTRRLDAWLRLAGVRVLRDDLRWLRTVAAPARDLDVLLRRSWPKKDRGALRAQRIAAGVDLAAALDSPRLSALMEALRPLPPLSPARLRSGLRALARGLVEMEVDPSEPDDVHRRRRRLRRLRYGRELVGADVQEIVQLQDALGALSDALLPSLYLSTAPAEGVLEAAMTQAESAWQAHLPAIQRWM